MYPFLATASLLAQVVGLFSLGYLCFDLMTLPDALIEPAAGDEALVRQYIAETVVSYGAWLGAGLLGGVTAWLLILKDGYRAGWFLTTSRVLAWLWMPLIPPGTLLGVLILSARAAAFEESQP